MGDIGCTVTIDGSYSGTYYVPCEYVDLINNDSLINTSNTTITLYPSIRHYNSNSYDYIRCNSYSYPIYYKSYSSTQELTDITSVTFNSNSSFQINLRYIDIFIMFLLALASLCICFKRG